MPTYEIPRQKWPDFCESFTRQHRGLPVSVEIVPPGEAPRIEVEGQPLLEVDSHPRRSGKGAVHIRTGRQPGDQTLDFRVQPTRLLFALNGAREQVGLILEGSYGAQTRLLLQAPFPPEALDELELLGESR
jgi:hypothetical protein